MAVVPPNNLPPESQPWARDRDAAISQLQFDTNKSLQDIQNSFTGVNNALTAITEQIADLAAVSAATAAAAAAASAASSQASSAAAQALAAATAANAALAAVVTGTVIPSVTTAAWSVSTTYGIKATSSVTVPSGYTKALVIAIGSAGMTTNDTVTDTTMYVYTTISGDDGGYMTAYLGRANGANRPSVNVTTSHTRVMTGLSGGSSIPVGVVVGISPNASVDLQRAQISGQVIFYN